MLEWFVRTLGLPKRNLKPSNINWTEYFLAWAAEVMESLKVAVVEIFALALYQSFVSEATGETTATVGLRPSPRDVILSESFLWISNRVRLGVMDRAA